MPLIYVDTAGVWDWTMYQGDTRFWTFSLEDPDGNPIDLTGVAVTMSVKRQRGANVPLIWSGSTGDGAISVGGTNNNVVSVVIPSADSEGFPAGSLVYDVEFTESGINITYLTGTITVATEVTK
jgi:hypothetical protein